jgi:uncharacterized protein (TIGR02246 family)
MKRALVICLVLAGCVLLMDIGDSAEKRSPEETAIRNKINSYTAAFQRRDAKALAAHWAKEAVYLNPETGEQVQGRDKIEAYFAAQFADEGPGEAKLAVSVKSLRFITNDVAIEDGTAKVTRPGEAPETSSYTAVHVKQGNDWLLDSVRETTLPPEPTGADRLAELDWLTGHWVDEDDNARVSLHCYWTAGQAFLTRSFDVEAEGILQMKGTQIIGWDPVAQSIRSWTFDSDGGVTEGTWRRDGSSWVISNKCILADGRVGSQTNVLRQIDMDRFTWKTVARQIGGELLPNVDEVVVVRQTEILAQEGGN